MKPFEVNEADGGTGKVLLFTYVEHLSGFVIIN
jgi:hypothetical protein